MTHSLLNGRKRVCGVQYNKIISIHIRRGSFKGKELYVENIFEELDQPGEWFFDEDTRLLYLMVNETERPPRNLWGTRLANLVTIQGSMSRPVCDTCLGLGLVLSPFDG